MSCSHKTVPALSLFTTHPYFVPSRGWNLAENNLNGLPFVLSLHNFYFAFHSQDSLIMNHLSPSAILSL